MNYLQCPNPRCNSFEVKSSKGFSVFIPHPTQRYFYENRRKIINIITFGYTILGLILTQVFSLDFWAYFAILLPFIFLTPLPFLALAKKEYQIKVRFYSCKRCKYKWQVSEPFGEKRPLVMTWYTQTIETARKKDDKTNLAACLTDLGSFTGERDNDWPKALNLCQEALMIAEPISDRRIYSYCLNNVGWCFTRLGQFQQALPLLERSASIFYQLGNWEGYAVVLESLGEAWLFLRQYSNGVEHLKLSLEFKRKMQKINSDSPLGAIEGMAAVAAAGDDMERALKLWGAAQAARERFDTPLTQAVQPFYDYVVQAAYARLGQPTAIQSHEAGRAMSVEEAIDYALS